MIDTVHEAAVTVDLASSVCGHKLLSHNSGKVP